MISFKDKIFIHQNKFQSTVQQRYGSIGDNFFDGIHTTNTQGKIEQTQNVLNALYDSSKLRHKYTYIPTNPQYRANFSKSDVSRQEGEFQTIQNRFRNSTVSRSKESAFPQLQRQTPYHQQLSKHHYQQRLKQQQTDSKGFSVSTYNRYNLLSESTEWSDQVEAEQISENL